jgi:hypothetical protein
MNTGDVVNGRIEFPNVIRVCVHGAKTSYGNIGEIVYVL